MASSEDLDHVKLASAFLRASAFILSKFPAAISWIALFASCMSRGSYKRPLTPSVTTKGTATARGPTTAMPAACDSMKTRSKVPVTVGEKKMSADATVEASCSPVTAPGMYTSGLFPISRCIDSHESPWPMMAKRHNSGSPGRFVTFTKSMSLSTCFSGESRPTKTTRGRSGLPLLQIARVSRFALEGWKNSKSHPVAQKRVFACPWNQLWSFWEPSMRRCPVTKGNTISQAALTTCGE